MGNYSIKELEKLSGIKAHTIRIWEKRHNIVTPQRTNTNIRYYSDDDLKKIINVSLLNNNGVKISKIVDLTPDELAKKVHELSNRPTTSDIHIDQLIVAMVDLEEENFDKALGSLILRYGFEKTITDIVYPFLEKIGVLWQTGNITPAQEHFISNLIRQKLIVAIDSLPVPSGNAPRALLFLPENELHELGLLFHNYIAKKAGFRTYYFGQSVPYDDIMSVCLSHSPKVLVTSVVSSHGSHNVEAYFTKLCSDQPGSIILAGGQILKKMALKMPKNLRLFFSNEELKRLLSAHR